MMRMTNATTKPPRLGRSSLFRRKAQPISVTLTRTHQRKLKTASARLDLSRSDVVSLLIELFADVVRVPADLVMEQDAP